MSFPLTRLGKSGFQIVNIENDGSGNPLFVGWARPGSANADPAWVIVQVGYTGGFITSIRYATVGGDVDDALSYDKQWTARAGYTYI